MNVLHLRLLGVNAETGEKLLLSAIVIGAIFLIRYAIVWTVRLVTGEEPNERVVFWTRQGASLISTIFGLLALVSIWFDDPTHLTTAAGLIGAGLAFALQKVVTAFAGYLVILRGKTFTVGDRITMGGVRGDVISLGFLQTRIMEMGEPPDAQTDANPIWVHARQYTGRVVTVTNDKVFDEPVYNFTREFPFIFEEIKIPVSYQTDRKKAEAILLESANAVVDKIEEVSEPIRREMEKKYFIDFETMKPRVYYKITDNWVEMTLRFIVKVRGVRAVKDELSRMILDKFDEAKIGIASGTYEVVGFPPIRIEGPVANRIATALEEHAADSALRQQTHR
ncbi:MAG TPA: mechanosensitive ion channel domain-containing protein [Rhodanobacteraceae bacterium]